MKVLCEINPSSSAPVGLSMRQRIYDIVTIRQEAVPSEIKKIVVPETQQECTLLGALKESAGVLVGLLGP